MELEDVRAADLPAFHALIERAYRGDTARAGWTHEADLLVGPRTSLAELQDVIDNPAKLLLMWREEGHVRAGVLLHHKGDGLAYLGMLTVEPGRQGGGLGKRLLRAAEAEADRRWGARRVEMQVFPQRTALIAFYGRHGYRLTGERRPFPYAEAPTAGALRDDLEFVVLEKPLA
jgi:ribosomal protein S18 acetylase RimI-like enzyme